MIKHIVRSIASVALLLAGAGCIDATTAVIVKKDGSGYIAETVYMSAAAQEMINGMMAGFGDNAGAMAPEKPEKMPLEIEKYKTKAKKMGEGVTYFKAVNIKKDDGSQGVRVIYKFTDVSKIKISQNPDAPSGKGAGGPGGGMMGAPGGAMMGAPAEEKPEKPVTFSFVPGDEAKLTIKLPKEESKETDVEMADDMGGEMPPMDGGGMGHPDPQGEQMMKAMFAGMRLRLIVKVEGEITKSNASHFRKSSKTGKKNGITLFDMDIGKLMSMPEHMDKLQALGPGKDVTDVKDALNGIPGMKVETEQEVKISFK